MPYNPSFFRAIQRMEERAGDHEDWCPPGRMPPMELIAPSERCRQVLYLHKWPWIRLAWPAGSLPGSTMAFCRNTPATLPYVRLIRRELAVVRRPLSYIGDLDPYSLIVFLTLRVGGIAGEKSREPALDVEYAGINDSWLALCERHRNRDRLPRDHGRLGVELQMSTFERESLRWLESLDIDWDAIVGPRSMALLRSGWKLELEGACNPGAYDAAFPQQLFAHLFAHD